MPAPNDPITGWKARFGTEVVQIENIDPDFVRVLPGPAHLRNSVEPGR